jgi:hypothetical protein
MAGRDLADEAKDGIHIIPAILAAIEPEITSAVIKISSKGLLLLSTVSFVAFPGKCRV